MYYIYCLAPSSEWASKEEMVRDAKGRVLLQWAWLLQTDIGFIREIAARRFAKKIFKAKLNETALSVFDAVGFGNPHFVRPTWNANEYIWQFVPHDPLEETKIFYTYEDLEERGVLTPF